MTKEERELSIEYLEGIKDNYIEGYGYERHPLPEYYAIENAIKALEQQTTSFEWCTDCKEYDQEKHCCHRWSKVIRNTVEEMKREPCEDCISREDILNHQYTIDESEALGISTRNVVNVDDILNAKPVQPKSKTGHWISYWDEEARCHVYKCPECGNKQPFDTKYCWECGTRLNVPDTNDGKMSEIPIGSESESDVQ